MGIHIQFLLLYIIGHVTAQWIDPHSMDSIKNYQKVHDIDSYSTSAKTSDLNVKPAAVGSKLKADIYYKRIVRLLLNDIRRDEGGGYNGYFKVQLTERDYEYLRTFAMGETDSIKEDVFAEVNSIMETALQKSTVEQFGETVLSVKDHLYFMIFNDTFGIILAAIFLIFICYKLLQANFSLWSVTKYVLALMYVADLVGTYLHLVEKLEIEKMAMMKMHGNIPPKCDLKNLGWWDYFKVSFKLESECTEYYKLTLLNTRLTVTPLMVLTHQFGAIAQILEHIGKGMGRFGNGMYEEIGLRWGLGPTVILPLMLLTVCVILFIIFTFITGTGMKFSLLYSLFHFELVSKDQGNLAYVNHRKLVEDIRASEKGKGNGKIGNAPKKKRIKFTEDKSLKSKAAVKNAEKKSAKSENTSCEVVKDNVTQKDPLPSEIETKTTKID